MNGQPHRLAASAPHGFGGTAIDRGQPIRFTMDGRVVQGFAGDTVLSALLASGFTGFGRYGREQFGLSERFAPPILLAGGGEGPGHTLAMARTPALDGADYLSTGMRAIPFSGIRFPGRTGPRSLDLLLDEGPLRLEPWRTQPATDHLSADLLVVGGGVAGLEAARVAARIGLHVILAERRPAVGGNAAYFGATDREEAPAVVIPRLHRELLGFENVTILTRTDVFDLREGVARAHRVLVTDGRPFSRHLRITAERIVLATGALERLPLFAGNRGPMIAGALAAFHRAHAYGVWPGRETVIATQNNFAYRLGLLARDAGISVGRIADSRVLTVSRFVDFAKASGITLAAGTAPVAAEPLREGRTALHVSVAVEGSPQQNTVLETDAVIAAGGMQPDLTLWLAAGGRAHWNPVEHRLEAAPTGHAIRLAGSAAGYHGLGAAMRSADSAVADLLGRPAKPVDDPRLPEIYETPDGPATPSGYAGKRPVYFDHGEDFHALPPPRRPRRLPLLHLGPEPPVNRMSLLELTASVTAGLIPAADAAAIAEVHCVPPLQLEPRPAPVPRTATEPMPAYLAGRFGAKPQFALLYSADHRSFETGCLVFAQKGNTGADAAVGVVLAPLPGSRGGGRALLTRQHAAGAPLLVRDAGGLVAVHAVLAPAAEA